MEIRESEIYASSAGVPEIDGAQTEAPVYFWEESLKQIKLRADRMGTFTDDLLLLCETNIETIRSVIEKERPSLVVIDSIQTMYSEEVSSAPGSVSQVREPPTYSCRLPRVWEFPSL